MTAFGKVWELIELLVWQCDFRITLASAKIVFRSSIWWVEYQPLRLSFVVEVGGHIWSGVCSLSRA